MAVKKSIIESLNTQGDIFAAASETARDRVVYLKAEIAAEQDRASDKAAKAKAIDEALAILEKAGVTV